MELIFGIIIVAFICLWIKYHPKGFMYTVAGCLILIGGAVVYGSYQGYERSEARQAQAVEDAKLGEFADLPMSKEYCANHQADWHCDPSIRH